MAHLLRIIGIFAALTIFTSTAKADCECGFLVKRDTADIHFMNTIVTDFTDPNLSDIGTDWIRNNYPINGTPKPQYYYPSNVYRNPGGNGLSIRTQAYSGSGYVGVGAIQTARTDILYGSFRAELKTSPVPGVCQSIFFYHSDTQEVDIELLSSHPQDQHLTNQPHYTTVTTAGFDPTAAFHEYRFDWLSTETDFFVDSVYKATLTKYSPNTPGEILINNWSNGDPTWSEGPPSQDAILTVGKVTLYFNTTSDLEMAKFAKRCGAAGGLSKRSVCHV